MIGKVGKCQSGVKSIIRNVLVIVLLITVVISAAKK